MKRIALLIFFTFSLLSDSSAQFFVKGGINWTKLNPGSSSVFFNGIENKRGLLFGMYNKFNFSDFVSLRPGMQFSSKGNKLGLISNNLFNDYRYLEAPIDIVYTLGNISFHTGTYAAYLITATRSDQNIKDNLSPLDLGLNIGMGISFYDFGIGINYGLGIVDINRENSGNTVIKNKAISIYLTYTQY